MAEGKCVGCENITKYLCLKCNALVCNRSLKCSVPASENYCGWKEWTKVVNSKNHQIFKKRGGGGGGGAWQVFRFYMEIGGKEGG